MRMTPPGDRRGLRRVRRAARSRRARARPRARTRPRGAGGALGRPRRGAGRPLRPAGRAAVSGAPRRPTTTSACSAARPTPRWWTLRTWGRSPSRPGAGTAAAARGCGRWRSATPRASCARPSASRSSRRPRPTSLLAAAAGRLARQAQRAAAVAVGDRQPPVAAEGARRDADPGRGLAALVLGAIDERDHPLDLLGRQPAADELRAVEVLLHVAGEDLVEQLVGG